MVAAKPKSKTTWVPTQEALAAELQVSTTTVRTWHAKGLPKPGKRGYHIAKVKKWKEENIRPRNGANVSSDRARLLAAQATKAEATAREAMLRIELLENDFIRRDDLNAFMSAFLAEVRTRLMRLPITAAPAYGNRADFFRKDLSERIELELKNFHGWLLKTQGLVQKDLNR